MYRSETWKLTVTQRLKSLSRDAVGGVDGLAFTGVRDGHIDAAGVGAEVCAVLHNSHTVTDGPELVFGVAELDERAHSGAVNARVVAGHRCGTVNSELD